MTRLEICIDNLESLFTAQAAGADRIELCSALGLGGLTPSYGFMQQVARHATVPVYAMIRPRAGDFCFNDGEFEMMLLDIAAARAAGLQGVVVGLLDEDGRVPEGKLRQLVEAAGPLGVTFHRAIDLSSDWRLDLETIVAAGCERILSSGHAPTALAGLETLQAILPEADFFRANRQFIVARRAVKEIAVWFGSRLSLSLVLETPERIVISKARVPEFKAWLTSVQPAE